MDTSKKSIRNKMITFTVVIFLCFMIIISAQIFSLLHIKDSANKVYSTYMPILECTKGARESLQEGEVIIMELIQSKIKPEEYENIREYSENFRNTMAKFEMYINVLTHGSESKGFKGASEGKSYKLWLADSLNKRIVVTSISDKLKTLSKSTKIFYEGFTNNSLKYFIGNKKVLRMEHLGFVKEARALKYNTEIYKKDINKFRLLTKDLINQIDAEVNVFITDLQSNMSDVFKQILYSTIVFSVVMLIGTLVFSILFTNRTIIYPIRKLILGTKQIGEGDLSRKIEINTKDEFNTLALSFNQMSKDLQDKTVSKDYVDNIIQSMNDTLIVANSQGTINSANQAATELLNYKEEELIGKHISLVLDGENTEELLVTNGQGIENLSSEHNLINRDKIYVTKDGKQIPVLFSGTVMKNSKGATEGIVYVAQDITEIKAAEQQIRKSLKEKEVLLQEIHHRVKNNLQIIIGQLTLQSRKVSDEIALDAFKTSVNRVRSMALIHEKVYQSDDLSSVGFHEYIESLCRDLMRTYGQKDHIEISIDVDEINMNIEKAIPCALIINELITNSIKYAFPNESKGKITINVKLINENDVKLTVKDDGIGVPKDFDINKADSLGLMIVRNLTLQLEGDLEHNFTNGTEFSLTFPFEMNKIPEFKKSI